MRLYKTEPNCLGVGLGVCACVYVVGNITSLYLQIHKMQNHTGLEANI